MIIDLSSFLDDTNELLHFEGNLEIDGSDLTESDIVIVNPVKIIGDIFKVDGNKEISMKISYTYNENCHRCLESTTKEIETILSGKLVNAKDNIESDEEEGYDEIFYYEKELFDIREYIVNQVGLSVPMKSLCSPECKGLCITCGADLNKAECNCVKENIDPRFENLKKFFPKN